MPAPGCTMSLGNRISINASADRQCSFNLEENTSKTVGDDCLFSNNIQIHTTDYHSITNSYRERINRAEKIVIGNHVWVGMNVTILKGVSIADNSVVATGSIVTKKFEESIVILAGVPARIAKKEINWTNKKL